ncbi:MAG: 2-C-methyl-D-erythritol 4-phosphate cytidylyltransferase [Salinivirgaceae bacterium]
MQKYVLIVAGGSGKRMKRGLPKQFIEVDGLPILMHTMNQFFTFDPSMPLTLILPETQQHYWQILCEKHNFTLPHQICPGGPERFFSVKNGLDTLPDKGLVAVHDGVRPLVSNETIKRCFQKAEKTGAAIPVMPLNESLRQTTPDSSIAVDRSNYVSVQTPQVFSVELLKKAYQQKFDAHFTDDASVVEKLNHPIHLVEGNPENIKITRPMDLLIAEALIKSFKS